ncbi:hypothetical protein, partial [Desulfovibrio piger]
ISVGRKSESQSSFPFAIHLSMNHAESLGAKQLFTPLRFRCQQVFFILRKFFFAAPQGQLVGAKETYVSFSNPRQELFCHPGKSPSPSPLRTWPVRWRERLYAPFRPHRQAFFRKRTERCCRAVKKSLACGLLCFSTSCFSA